MLITSCLFMVKAPTIFKCFGSALQKAPVAQCSLGLRVTLARSQLLSAHKGIHLIATGIFSPCCAALEVVWQAGLAVLPAQGSQLHLTAGSVIHVLPIVPDTVQDLPCSLCLSPTLGTCFLIFRVHSDTSLPVP